MRRVLLMPLLALLVACGRSNSGNEPVQAPSDATLQSNQEPARNGGVVDEIQTLKQRVASLEARIKKLEDLLGSQASKRSAAEKVYPVNAAEVLSGYETSSDTMQSKLKGRLLEVTGEAGSVTKDVLGQPLVIVAGAKGYAYHGYIVLHCIFPEGYDVSSVKKGDTVRIRGRFNGQTDRFLLTMSRCTLVTSDSPPKKQE